MEPIEVTHRPSLSRHADGSRFSTLVIDADSILSGINGIQWLAERRGDVVVRKVAKLAAQATEGAISAEDAFREQLIAIRPRRADVDALSRAYVEAMAPGCADVLAQLRRVGVRVILLSAGLRHALYGLAYRLGIDAEDVHAVGMRFDELGAFLGCDRESPLITAAGKRTVLAGLAVDRPVIAVGADVRDFALRDIVDSFVAFTGFIECEEVVRQADGAVASFRELAALIAVSGTPLRGERLVQELA